MVFPYENFYWVKIKLDTRDGRHRYGVVVHPNVAKVIDLGKGTTMTTFVGHDREAQALAEAIERMKNWDRHIYCCWFPKYSYPEPPAEPQVAKKQRTRGRKRY